MDKWANVMKSCPKTKGFTYRYGTAGFREKADVLDAVFLRTGFLSGLRAWATNQAVGLMVTASHNMHGDNGVKVVDPDGSMLEESWEAHATDLANADDDKAAQVLVDIVKAVGIEMDKVTNGKGKHEGIRVYLGRDTRIHSERFAKLVATGIESVNCTVVDIGVCTTPQLHHCVRSYNLLEERELATLDGYNLKLSEAFHDLVGDKSASEKVIIDGAYGVGGLQVVGLMEKINENRKVIDVEVRNAPTMDPSKQDEEANKLNNGVGAEHVQKKLQFPENTLKLPAEQMTRFCSFDGDADRIVYFRADEQGALNLLDGDKIATLLTSFIQKQVAGLPSEVGDSLNFACVQTAYANGASSNYIKDILKVDAPLTKTGVKYLHHKAVEYDVGCYFEANGHGTVLFRPSFIEKLKSLLPTLKQENQKTACKNLLALEQLINQATGDAMADFLAVEATLILQGMALDDWVEMYSDLPSRQLKCQVRDRTIIKTSDDESRVLEPKVLQDCIDAVVNKFPKGRAFARPSGTEDAVRVYAEASTQEKADELSVLVLQAVFDNAGGVGERP